MSNHRAGELLVTMETQRQADFEMRMYDRVEKLEEALRDSEQRNAELREAIKELYNINKSYLEELQAGEK